MHHAWSLIQEVEGLGGMTRAIEKGLPKLRIEEAAARRQARIDAGHDVIVGVNRYRPSEKEILDTLEVDHSAVRRAQLGRLAGLRAGRDPAAVAEALEALRRGASGTDNVLALAIDAVRAKLGADAIAKGRGLDAGRVPQAKRGKAARRGR